MMMRFTRLARDDRGASIIELALVAPILASLLIGMVDLSRAYSSKLLLEQAAQRSIEKVQQYQASSSTSDADQGGDRRRGTSGGLHGGDRSDVTVDFWLECDGVRAANYDIDLRGRADLRPLGLRRRPRHFHADVPLSPLAWREHQWDVHSPW